LKVSARGYNLLSSGTSPLGSLMNNPQLLQALYPGLNLTGFSQLQQEEQAALEQPIQNTTAEVSNFTQISQTWSGIQADVNALSSDATTLASSSTWSSPTASVSTTGVVGASASSSANGGSYTVNVTNPGAYDQWLGQSESSATTALSLQGSFSINGTSVSVSSSDTLTSIASKINAADAGATATVMSGTVNGVTSYYLALSSTQYTALNITDPNSVLKGTGSSGLGLAEQPGTGTPWIYTVNGVQTSSTTGTDSTTVPGLALTLQGAGSATVTVSTSTSQAQTALAQFVSDYNALQSAINKATGKGDILQGDATAEGIMQQINSILLSSNSSAPLGYQSVSNAGVTLNLQSDNTTQLAFSASDFQTAATADAQALQNVFTGASGVATQLQTLLGTLGDTSTGVIAGILTNVQSQISNLTNQETQEQSLITAQQNAMQDQFNQEMQALLAVSAQKSQLSGLLTAVLNGGSSSSSSSSSSGG